MKGLFTKDLLLITGQKRTIMVIILMGAIMSLSFDASVIVIYLTILGTMFSVSTLSYDEYDNGYPFLLTLPVSRKTYVREKYLLALCAALLFMAAGLIISFAVSAMRGGTYADIVSTAAGSLLAGVFMIAIIVPLRLKYGSEKSRIALYIVYAVAAVMIFAGSKLLESAGMKEPVIAFFAKTGPGIILGGIVLLALIALAVSEQISEKVMIAKEY